ETRCRILEEGSMGLAVTNVIMVFDFNRPWNLGSKFIKSNLPYPICFQKRDCRAVSALHVRLVPRKSNTEDSKQAWSPCQGDSAVCIACIEGEPVDERNMGHSACEYTAQSPSASRAIQSDRHRDHGLSGLLQSIRHQYHRDQRR